MLSGFFFYLYHTADRKGWFDIKVRYYTLADSAIGLQVGDPVKLMGFDVGEITRIDAQPPEDFFNVYVEFQIKEPYYGYLWSEGSMARVSPTDFLGKRSVEVTKGTSGVPTYIEWELRELALPTAQALTNFQDLVMAQQVVRTEEDMILAVAGQPLSADLLAYFGGAGIDSITVADRQRAGTNEITLAEAAARTNLTSLALVYDVLRPREQEILIPAMTPLSREVVDQLTRRGVQSFLIADKGKKANHVTAFWDFIAGYYREYSKETKPYWLPPDESPALTDRLESVVSQVEGAVPSVLSLTNQLAAILNSATGLTFRVDSILAEAQPIVTNLAEITGNLRDPEGSLGNWLIPEDLNTNLLATLTNASATLATANSTLATADTNLATLASSLNLTLLNLAGITSNLNAQVQTTDQIVSQVSRAIVQANDLMEGLKRHWLLRSAFPEEQTNRNQPPARRPPPPRTVPRPGGLR
jgi:hypothetical protein